MGWEEGTAGEGFADEAEEFFPTAGDYETDVFGVVGGYLVLVDCALGGLILVSELLLCYFILVLERNLLLILRGVNSERVLTGGTLAKSPGLRDLA